MNKLMFSILLTASVLAAHVYAQGGYPLGSDVATTITTNKINIVGTAWDTKRPALYKGAISAILDSSTASLTSAVTVIEGTRQSF